MAGKVSGKGSEGMAEIKSENLLFLPEKLESSYLAASKRYNEIIFGNDGSEQIQDPDNPDAIRITQANGDVDVYHKATGKLLNHIDILDAEVIG